MYSRISESSCGQRTPSPKSNEPPLETSPLQPPRLQRSNAIRRVDNRIIRRRREDLLEARSGSSNPVSQGPRKEFSFANMNSQIDNGMHLNPFPSTSDSNGDSDWHKGKSHTRADESRARKWTEMRRLPGILTFLVKQGMPADEVGHYLELLVYGKDKFLGEMVTNSVNANEPYQHIAIRVLKTMDLRDDNGSPVYEQIKPAGNPMRRPNRPRRYQVNREARPRTSSVPYADVLPLNEGVLTCEHPNTTGPELICPKKPSARAAALDHRTVRRFVKEAEASLGHASSAEAVALDHRAGKRFLIEVDTFQGHGQDDGVRANADCDDEEDSESDDTDELGLFEECYESDSDHWSELIDEYFKSLPEVSQAEEVVISKSQGPARLYANVDNGNKSNGDRANVMAASAVITQRRGSRDVGSRRAPRRPTPFHFDGQPF